MKFTFSIVQVAHAHEEGATSVTPNNIIGPFLTLIIIVLAVVVARRINPVREKSLQATEVAPKAQRSLMG